MIAIKNNMQNSQKTLAAQVKTDRMNSDETTSDGVPGSGLYPKGSGGENSPKMISVTGANTFQTGFTKPNLDAHFSKHKKDYAGISKQQYGDEALLLIQSKAEGDIRGYVRENGQIVRYNRITGDLVIGNNQPNGENAIGIATMHKVKEAKYERLLKEEAFGDDYC
ncbi:MAG: hypothetical protein LBL73_01960 [Synergistaceae bacterium]|nr:hypothetical protein [Synergistaceae bacterium]